MRRIVASLFMSLDGVMGGPDAWAFPYSNDEMEEANQKQMSASDALLLGRVTYKEFAAFWPYQSSDNPVTGYIIGVRKYVVSSTLDKVAWQNSSLIRGDVVEELTKLKQQPGKDITVTGSATLFQSLFRDAMLDELRLMVPPVIVGGGKRLFADERDRMPLKLVDAETFSTGVLYLTYQPTNA